MKPDGLCWACADGKCGQAKKDNLCTCCRHGHARRR